jgi:uncharacterized protein YbjT (DUF2867 family)
MKILVTAARGKVGHSLINQLARHGHRVRAGMHSLDDLPALPSNVEPVTLEFADAHSVRTAMDGVDTVVLITPPSPLQVDYATVAIDMAKEAKVRHVVRLSVLAAAMEPGIQLGRWHRVVERYLQASGLEWTIVRPGPFFQKLQGMYSHANRCFELPAADAPVNHIDVDDVASALSEILEAGSTHTGKIHMVTGKEGLTFADIARRLSVTTGKDYRYEALDPKLARDQFSARLPAPLVPVVVELFSAFRTGAVGMKTSTFHDLVGRDPRSIEDFAESLDDGSTRAA